MKYVIEHVFAMSAAAYEALYFDEPFSVALGAALGLGRELIRLERDARRIVRHVRCEPRRDPGSPAGQAFGTSRASFLEEIDYDVATRRGVWRTVPNLFPDRVRSTGTLELVERPDGVARVVRGEVKVSALGFGGLIEKMIVAEITKSYAQAAAFTAAWAQGTRSAPPA